MKGNDQDKNKLLEVQDSAAKHINYRGEKVNEIGERYYLPCPGKVILYNEVNRANTRSGSPGHYKRGIGRVKQYSRNTMQLEYYANPNCKYIVSFQTNDFLFGRFRYVNLKENVLINKENIFTYDDLDIKKPHIELSSLFISGINRSYSLQMVKQGV